MQLSLDQSYETSLTSTIIINVIVSLAIMLLFPVLRFIFPVVYSPLHYEEHINTGFWGELLWFVDVFMQPLQVYAKRGNMTLMFVILQNFFLALFSYIVLLSVTVLIPAYLSGNDQYMNTTYLTVWSRMSLVHLEEGSPLLFLPVCMIIVTCFAVMFVYTEFNLIYINYRQKTFERIIPQNYVLMLSNIPEDVNTLAELKLLLRPVSNGILEVLPSPPHSNKLFKKAEKLKGLVNELNISSINEEKLAGKTLSLKVKREKFVDNISEEQLMQCIIENDKLTREYFVKHEEAKYLKMEIMKDLVNLKIRAPYFADAKGYPPKLLEPMEKLFGNFNDNDYSQIGYEFDHLLSEGAKNAIKNEYLGIEKNNNTKNNKIYNLLEDKHEIGRFAFVICDSQIKPNELATDLLTVDSECPKAQIAPTPELINWKNLSIRTVQRNLRIIGFIIVLAVLFVVYFYIQAIIMGKLTTASDEWMISMANAMSGKKCSKFTKENINVKLSGECGFAQSVASTIATFVPSLVNSFLMSLLPFLIDWTIDILGFPSDQEKQQYSFTLLFVFLILIEGIVEVALPQAIQVETGKFDISLIFSSSITSFLKDLGQNIPRQTFVFINYIIAKYFLFPALGLLNIPNAFFCLLYILFSKNSMEKVSQFESFIFKYPKQLAYISHMMCVAFIFCVIAPVTNIIVLFTYLMTVVTDRYYVLYISKPDETTELQHQSELMKSVINTLYISLIFMLIACFSFFLQYAGWQYIGTQVVIVICLVSIIIYKVQFDQRYGKAMNELALGHYELKGNMYLNVAENENDFSGNKQNMWRKMVKQSAGQSPLKRNNCISKWIKKHYYDLDNLPISYTLYKSVTEHDTISYLLNGGSQETDLVGEYHLNESDVKRVMQHYSHPAMAYTFGNELSMD